MFTGKTVLITGATSGIGQALARELAALGAALVVTGRRQDRLQSLVRELEATGALALSVPGDVRDPESLQEAVTAAIECFGRLDVVVANAGFGVAAPFEELTLDDFRRQFDTNVLGVVATCQAALLELRKSGGRLVLMGSVAGHVSAANSTPYSMSKFAVRALADGLRAELAGSGVSVTLISPGFVQSEIRQLDNLGQPRNDVEPIPPWLVMPAAAAARQIARAIWERRPEAVITRHGQLIVFLSRHAPGLTRWLLTRVRRGAGKELEWKR